MTAFNAAGFPLVGRRLIEASAGTGKTYNIANLYLRLLVGDNCLPKIVDEILVVTFTRAATDELRGRIREKIEMALQVFRGAVPRQDCKDGFISELLARQQAANAHKDACRLLNNALLRMDEACIFTIHGFAVRVIQTFLFETGALANVEISESGNLHYEQVMADLWRELQLTQDTKLASYVGALDIKDLVGFTSYFSKNIDRAGILPVFTINDSSQSLISLLKQADEYVDLETKKILDERNALANRWKKICANGEGEVKDQLNNPKATDLIKRINAWLISVDCELKLPGKATQIYDYMMSFTTSTEGGDLQILVRDVVHHVASGKVIKDMQGSAFRALLLQYINLKMADINPESMQLDDVVKLINQTLHGGGVKAAQLRSMITTTYPVCMVDEFQDTDPAQFDMFNQLYDGSADTGFFMIGDPKQSIYQFRGADIFSYLGVRSEVQKQEQASSEQHIFTLDTNFRSKHALVEATNRLFLEKKDSKKSPPTFVFNGIHYFNVKSCETENNINKGTYTVGANNIPATPLVFVGNQSSIDNDEKQNGDTLRWKFATDTAQRIAVLLESHNGGKINQKNLRGGDIAVLVRTAREANAIRAALALQIPRIGSVFQSQRDSVFSSSIIADDIYHLLCAIDDPRDKRLLKTAMSTLLYRGFRLDFSELDALAADTDTADTIFEGLINEFDDYRKDWEDYGVLSALNHFASRHALLQKMAALPDCDRMVTDLRHLGEILQHKYLECSSREELISWYVRQLHDDSDIEEDAKRIRLESDDNLVKIVTIHVSKGLEYPVVFLPFFFLPWIADSENKTPLYHPEPDYHPRVDFSLDASVIKKNIQKEMLAEDMRLLYVAMTRAIYQCYIGISAATHSKLPLFDKTVWAHLLGITEKQPGWALIKQSLIDKLGDQQVSYQNLFDVSPEKKSLTLSQPAAAMSPELLVSITVPDVPVSHWVITSYTALAHAKKEPGMRRGGVDEVAALPNTLDVDADASLLQAADKQWADDIRYRLQGSSRTGECLHGFYEQLAKDSGLSFDTLLQYSLRQYGLEKPEGINTAWMSDAEKQTAYTTRRQELAAWLNTTLQQPLLGNQTDSCLHHLFLKKRVLPELDFDFSLGSSRPAHIRDGINKVLTASGLEAIYVPDHTALEGFITGSIDLLFIHDNKVYVLDYKSNTLGKAPRFYDQVSMTQAIKDNRYDLQYLIYSVAAHRYMQQRVGSRYDYNQGEYRFGGVLYLFLRGMGLTDYPGHGVWFHRPEKKLIEALDAAFKGEEV